MTTKLFSEAISEVGDKYYEEAANYHCKKHGWIKWSAMAACLTVVLFTALSVLPNYFRQQGTTPPDNPNGVIVDNPIDTADDDTTPVTPEIHISMESISFNEVETLINAAPLWRDPELYDSIWWDRNDIIDYYGKDLTPVYVPDGLTAANGNGTAKVVADKSGNIVEDTVWLGFYHDYHENGHPKLTEGVTAYKGFFITVSKIGLLHDCSTERQLLLDIVLCPMVRITQIRTIRQAIMICM